MTHLTQRNVNRNTKVGNVFAPEPGPRFFPPATGAFLVLLLGLLAFLAGCARLPREPALFYRARPANLSELDTSCLIGKRIVLDPGHGGVFRGAVGRDGLEEAGVNLGVALHLWGLLRDAGVEVYLIRSSDIDFASGRQELLRDDLSRRIELATSFRPDLFISLHHNAGVADSRGKNQTETYFKMLDEGPSRDVAVLIHKYLCDNLGINSGEVTPGNYFVLRNSVCPAVLGEPSYITNPWVEQKLKLAEKQLLEAQAYFLALLEYFGRGIPRIESLSPRNTVVTEDRPTLRAKLAGDDSSVDTSSIVCRLDGVLLGASVSSADGVALLSRPEKPLASGEHTLCFSCRNRAGNSSGEACCNFIVELPPASMFLAAFPPGIPERGGFVISVALSDANGNRVRDGTPVRFSSTSASFLPESTGTSGGSASSICFPDTVISRIPIAATSGDLSDSLTLENSGVFTRCARVVSAATGEPLGGAQTWVRDSLICISTPQGLVALAGIEGMAFVVRQPGFIPRRFYGPEAASAPSPRAGASRRVETLALEPVAMGILKDKRFVIDIAAPTEGPSRQKPGATGKRSDEQALHAQVGTEVSRLLAGAGARVLLVGDPLSDMESVRRAELFSCDRYIRLEPTSEKSPSVLHYPGSQAGLRLAETIARWWGGTASRREPAAGVDAQYVLRQTSAPAVSVTLPFRLEDESAGLPARLAYAIYLGILEDAGLNADSFCRLKVEATDVSLDEQAHVVLDDLVSLPISENNPVTFVCEEGEHSVRFVSRTKRSGFWFVRTAKGRDVSLRMGREE